MGRQASLPQFSRALREVGDDVGPVEALIGHSLAARWTQYEVIPVTAPVAL
jgi:hypothetical protein